MGGGPHSGPSARGSLHLSVVQMFDTTPLTPLTASPQDARRSLGPTSIELFKEGGKFWAYTYEKWDLSHLGHLK